MQDLWHEGTPVLGRCPNASIRWLGRTPGAGTTPPRSMASADDRAPSLQNDQDVVHPPKTMTETITIVVYIVLALALAGFGAFIARTMRDNRERALEDAKPKIAGDDQLEGRAMRPEAFDEPSEADLKMMGDLLGEEE